MNRILGPVLFLLAFAAAAKAASPEPVQQHFESANKAYAAGQYAEAIAEYQKIIDQGIENAAVYYNIGNACFRQNRLGYAILYYEKASRFSPDDEDVKANLRFAQSRLADKIPEPSLGFLARALDKAHSAISLNWATGIVSFLFFGVCLLVIAGLFLRYTGRMVCLYLGIVLAFLLVVFGTNLAIKIHENETIRYAVVLASGVDALNEPEGNQTLFSVHEGIKFRVRKTLGDWMLVSLPNGMAGWVRAADLGQI